VRRGHGSSGDGVGGVLTSNPGRKDVETRGKDVVTLSKVGEVRAFVKKRRSTDGNSVLSSSRGIVARAKRRRIASPLPFLISLN